MDSKSEENVRESLPEGVTLISKEESLQSIPGSKRNRGH